MALTSFNCNFLTPLHFKGLKECFRDIVALLQSSGVRVGVQSAWCPNLLIGGCDPAPCSAADDIIT